MADLQVKVEYRFEKWITFFVEVSRVYCGSYSFIDLCEDIIQRCPSLNYLNVSNLRIKYEDDEGSYINLDYGDQKGFMEMWENAKEVPGRDYRRLKIKASEINSPCTTVFDEKIPKPKVTRPDNARPAASPKLQVEESSSCTSNYEVSGLQASSSTNKKAPENVPSPLERLFMNIEKEIETVQTDIVSKNSQLERLLVQVDSARTVNENRNGNNFQVCGQCHLREGHTKRNCTLGICSTAKSCGMLDKHPVEKGQKRKLESDISALENKLLKSQENYQRKKIAYAKVNDTFVSKIEEELIASDPALYVQNNCKNWLLINKHAAILEKKCGGKLPRRTEITKLLREETESPRNQTKVKSGASNPAKPELERHGIVFPSSNSPAFSLMRCALQTLEEEQSQLEMIIKHSWMETKQAESHNFQTMTPQVPQVPPIFGFPFLPPLTRAVVLPSSTQVMPDESSSRSDSYYYADGEENIEADAANSLLALKTTRGY